MALYLQSRTSEVYDTDIHPAARIGRGIMIDHATGVVVGSTAVIEDEVSLLQGVTLGGTGTADGARPQKMRRAALLGANPTHLAHNHTAHSHRVRAGRTDSTELG